MKRVLFVCVHNSGRSQMAEAFLNQIAPGKVEAVSAGTMPVDSVQPQVITAMRELGIDISRQRPKALTADMLESADRVVTMGCSQEQVCPASLVPVEDWQLEDPEGQSLDKVRQIRDEIRSRVEKLAAHLS
ncbi:MAG: low molecular weight phosphatase family protein [Chloroflexota bacterium]